MLNVAKEWRAKGPGWRAAAAFLFLPFALWLIKATATLLFERAMRPEWLDGALAFVKPIVTNDFTIGAAGMAAVVVCAPYDKLLAEGAVARSLHDSVAVLWFVSAFFAVLAQRPRDWRSSGSFPSSHYGLLKQEGWSRPKIAGSYKIS